jgi:hypothetical protein
MAINYKKFILLYFIFVPFIMRAQANVYVTPSTIVLSGQNTITLDVMIADVIDLHAYSVRITFNNSIVRLTSVTQGSFLSSGGSTLFFVNPAQIVDYVLIEAAILGTNTVSGSGKIFSLNFDVLSAGNSPITITLVQLLDHNNSNIQVNWVSGEILVPIAVKLKTFLQGPFNINEMNTTLNLSGSLPRLQPYSGAPWNYSGSESVKTGFFSTQPNIVDWVLIELRTGIGSNTIVERKAGFITNTGSIVGIDGTSSLYFLRPKGNYYVVIYHRNHIPIMSSNLTYLNYLSTTYDYTTGMSKAYGVNSQIQLNTGIFGMFAADANGNGQVQNNDKESYWIIQNGQSGYKESDYNLNGQVQNNDNETFWVPNNGKGTQVPN